MSTVPADLFVAVCEALEAAHGELEQLSDPEFAMPAPEALSEALWRSWTAEGVLRRIVRAAPAERKRRLGAMCREEREYARERYPGPAADAMMPSRAGAAGDPQRDQGVSGDGRAPGDLGSGRGRGAARGAPEGVGVVIEVCPTHERPLDSRGECKWCERLIERAESARGPVDGWQAGQAAYERWLDRIGGSR